MPGDMEADGADMMPLPGLGVTEADMEVDGAGAMVVAAAVKWPAALADSGADEGDVAAETRPTNCSIILIFSSAKSYWHNPHTKLD